jgi:hypothetical protein
MMKKSTILFLLFLLIFYMYSSIVSSVLDDPPEQLERIEITQYTPKVFYGKTIKYLGGTFDYANIDIDGFADRVQNNGKYHYINGVNLSFLYVRESSIYSNKTVAFNASVTYVCGNNVCEKNENVEVCCADCGCQGTKKCFDNQCINPNLNYCTNSTHCDDNNPCTTDTCEQLPRKCFNRYIQQCKSNDACCPRDCNQTNDNDCSGLTLCTADVDCDDNNPGTIDECSSVTSRCFYTTAELSGVQTPVETQNTTLAKSCTIDTDCNDNNTCTSDHCSQLTNLCYSVNSCNNTQVEPLVAKESNDNSLLVILALVVVITLAVYFLRKNK